MLVQIKVFAFEHFKNCNLCRVTIVNTIDVYNKIIHEVMFFYDNKLKLAHILRNNQISHVTQFHIPLQLKIEFINVKNTIKNICNKTYYK